MGFASIITNFLSKRTRDNKKFQVKKALLALVPAIENMANKEINFHVNITKFISIVNGIMGVTL